jgi:hypothetical protein
MRRYGMGCPRREEKTCGLKKINCHGKKRL